MYGDFMRGDEIKGKVFAGQKYGRWTVLDAFIRNVRNEKKWLCRCDCGTERYVLERSLIHNGSKSCGCLAAEAVSKALTRDLTGRVFGDLTVLSKSEKTHNRRGIWWQCKCSCGKLCEVLATLLATGKRTHCGDRKVHKGKYPFVDLTGQRFHRLTALYPTDKRSSGGSVIWHCRCDCGTELDLSHNELKYANVRSCGCQRKEHNQKLKEYRHFADGTSVEMIKSRKIPRNNTTGYKGVYIIRGKYAAKIVFQQKAYFLGTYERIEDAAQARREAEVILFERTAAFYERWKQKADTDPQWAQENPIKIHVKKDAVRGLTVSYWPEI